jgi:hypothetical protein
MIGSWMFFDYPHPLAGGTSRGGKITKQEWKDITNAMVMNMVSELERHPPHLLSSL